MRPARVVVDLRRRLHMIDPMIYGQFIEHLWRCVDGGIYDPGSPLADTRGFRTDVLDKVVRLAPSVLRWPGGTYSKVYHWQDGIGPARPRKKNVIWGGIEGHGFGTDEFVEYCRLVGSQPFLCVNMATGSAEEAAAWVEYCNGTEDTQYAGMRRAGGHLRPHGVRYWGLGNEEYSVPDIGSLNEPERYAEAAWQFAKYMKLTDPSIELVLVGKADDDRWNRRVLEQCGDICDYLSLHFYSRGDRDHYAQPFKDLDRLDRVLSSAERQLRRVPAEVRGFSPWHRFGPRRQKVRIALDEWNLIAPAVPTAGDVYGYNSRYCWRDALWVAGVLHLLHRHGAVVAMAQMAQMVNVIAPVVAEPGGTFVQTIFHPLESYRRLCGDRFVQTHVSSPPVRSHQAGRSIAALDVSATLRTSSGELVVAVVNRDLVRRIDARLEVATTSAGGWAVAAVHTMASTDWRAISSLGTDVVRISEERPSTSLVLPALWSFPPVSISLLVLRSLEAAPPTA